MVGIAAISSIVIALCVLSIIYSVRKYEQKQTTLTLYRSTYISKRVCRNLGGKDAELADIAINRFRSAYPEIMTLVDKSPYLPIESKDFEQFLSSVSKYSVKEDTSLDLREKYACEHAILNWNNIANMAGTEAGNRFSKKVVGLLSP